jgi:hypothetical protein
VLALPVSFVPEVVYQAISSVSNPFSFSKFTTNTSSHHTISTMDVFYAYVRKPLTSKPSLQQLNLLPDLRYSGMVGLAGSSLDFIPNHNFS